MNLNPNAIQLLQAAKKAVADSRNFNLDSFCSCLAPHVCIAAGDTVRGEEVRVNGQDMHVLNRAWSLLGFDGKTPLPEDFPGGMFCPSQLWGHHKDEAYQRIDRAIEWFGRNLPAQEPEPVVEEQELAYA